jgi:hypothetical protein
MELYYPHSVNPEHMVAIPPGGTLCCQEVNDILLQQMQMIGREDLTEEQIDNLVENLSKKTMLPWELYNTLLGYVEPIYIEDFRRVFDHQIAKHYVKFSDIDQMLASMEEPFKPLT